PFHPRPRSNDAAIAPYRLHALRTQGAHGAGPRQPGAEGTDMCFPIECSPSESLPRSVTYQWDAETELLAARLGEVRGSVRGTAAEGLYEGPNACGLTPAVSGSIELEGRDGSWLTLDVRNGRIEGIAVAVWPRIVRRPDLRAPTRAEYVH